MDQDVEVKVAALMTAPRYESTWARNIIEQAIHGAGLPLFVSGGVFYGHCMQVMLENCVAGEVDYALTVDFDSIFTTKDMKRLLRQVIENPNIDAITGMQVRRGKPTMLGFIEGGELQPDGTRHLENDGSPMEAISAHFGLTVIDIKKLAKVPKPWFWSQPDKDGCWTEAKVDDDVWFWRRWREAGNTIFIDPGVRLGHLEEMVAVHDENMQPIHMYPTDWVKQYGS